MMTEEEAYEAYKKAEKEHDLKALPVYFHRWVRLAAARQRRERALDR